MKRIGAKGREYCLFLRGRGQVRPENEKQRVTETSGVGPSQMCMKLILEEVRTAGAECHKPSGSVIWQQLWILQLGVSEEWRVRSLLEDGDKGNSGKGDWRRQVETAFSKKTVLGREKGGEVGGEYVSK